LDVLSQKDFTELNGTTRSLKIINIGAIR